MNISVMSKIVGKTTNTIIFLIIEDTNKYSGILLDILLIEIIISFILYIISIIMLTS